MRLDHFDLVARFYDRVFHFLGPEQLMSLLQARPLERILDIGGGTGRVSQTFGDDYVVVVCDPSWGMLREAGQKQMIACCGLAEHLPFANGAFDRMVMVDTFHHLRDQHVAAKEILRVLRPGGRLVIEEPDIRRRAVKWAALGERLLLMRSHFYSIADLARIFEEAGATIVALEEGHDYNVRLAVEKVKEMINGEKQGRGGP
ncbi:MAG: methyltransferase domain-containing protein [Chloroflexi bacterium]|nr:methyltransferase domain-containing protein [Chloroflexota bacterium]